MSDLHTGQHTHSGQMATGAGSARTMTIIGFVCAALAVLFLPIILGPAAIVLGMIARSKGDPLGKWAAIAGVVGLVAGIALGAMLANRT